MARVIWKGHISFGLVQIPVGLYPATSDTDLDLHMVDRRDMSPIGYKRVNKRTGEEVPSEEIAKAAEAAEGAWVLLEDEEIKAAAAESTRSIDIVAFIAADELDPRYFVRPYYVAPEKRTAKAYALLRETLRRSGKIGIAKVVLRTRQYLGALIVRGDILVLELLRYAEEVRDTKEFDLPKGELEALGVGDKELKMAELLVSSLEETWDPTRYHDEFRAQLERVIDEKARTGRVSAQPTEEAPITEAVDIMALLKRSLEAVKGKGAAPAAEPPPAAPEVAPEATPEVAAKKPTRKRKKEEA
ncbi:MAG: Ku protein [Myxococcota bacterium]